MSAPEATWRVAARDAGRRLDHVLAERLDEPRSQVALRVAEGRVLLDGVPARKSARVVPGQEVTALPAQERTPPRPPPVPVRWADEHLAVVAKPAGLVVHPGAGVADGTLVDALRAQGLSLADTGDPQRPGIVHRLDRGTSGLLLVASSDEAVGPLQAAIAAREVTRRYTALVDGVPSPARATIDAPLARERARRTRMGVDPQGRRAVTHYDVVEALGGAARLDVRLETGRTHQIRAHLAAIGHPVCGDAAYGAARERAERLGLARPALHAARLTFAHPVTGEPIDVAEPLPADLEAALAVLRDAPGPAAGDGAAS